MFLFGVLKKEHCGTLGPKKEHYPSRLVCERNIANLAVGHNTSHTTVGHNTSHTTLRWELISGGMGNVITCYNKAAHTHDATQHEPTRNANTGTGFRNRLQKLKAKKSPAFARLG